MEYKIIEVFKKYSKSVDTEYNVYNCLIEEDWSNIAQEVVKLLRQYNVSGQSEQLKDLLEKLLENNMCSHAGDELIKEVLKGF